MASLLLAACAASAGGDGHRLLTYEREWPDGTVESETVYDNGHVEMRHGDRLERMTIGPTDVERIEDALTRPIATGSPEDSPVRTLTLADGTVVVAPRPNAGSLTELLERLLDTHSLG